MICKVWRVNSEHPLKAIYWKNGLKYPSLGEWQTYANRLIQTELPINYVDDKTINVVLAYNDMIPYLMIQEPNNWSGGTSDRVNIKKYYIYNRTLEYSSNSRICEYTLDYYATYVLPMINLQVSDSYYWFGDVNTLAIRSSDFNFETAKLFEDPLIQDVKMIGDYQFFKSYFSKRVFDINGTTYIRYETQGKYALSFPNSLKDKMINGVCYAVFGTGEKGSYTYIPILAKDNTPIYWNTMESGTSYSVVYKTVDGVDAYRPPFEKSLSERKWVNEKGEQIPWSAIRSQIISACNKNWNVRFLDYKNNILYQGTNSNIVNNTYVHYSANRAGSGSSHGQAYRYLVQWKPSVGNITTIYDETTRKGPTAGVSNISVVIPITSVDTAGTIIYNNVSFIDEMKFSKEFSNKFIGFFFLPHVLHLAKYAILKTFYFTDTTSNQSISLNFLTVNIPPEGVQLEPRVLASVVIKPNNDNSMTLPIISENPVELPPYYYKYLKARYYNNDIDLSLFYDENKNAFISKPYLLFSGSGMLVEKVAGVPISKCTWTLPYQLPSGSDAYINYVNSTYNTANTSVAIAKQNMIYSGITGLLGAIGLGASSGLTGLLAAGFPKPLAGLAGGAIGANKLFGTGGSILTGTQSIQKIKAQYADAKNTYGTEVSTSNIQDAAWIEYMLIENEQYDGIELFSPSMVTINQMTQTWMRYGFYCPTYRSLRSVIDSRKGGYIQFDANSTELALGNWMTTAPWWYTEEVISYIYNLMTEGFWVNEWN